MEEKPGGGQAETLEGIFARALAEGAIASLEPQEMEEHRLDRFAAALHSSDEEE